VYSLRHGCALAQRNAPLPSNSERLLKKLLKVTVRAQANNADALKISKIN
jgi:hypothetical protein